MHSRRFGTLIGVALLLSVPAFATATALDIGDPWNPANPADELNVYEIYNTLYGTAFTASNQLNGLEASDQVFDYGDTSITVNTVARYAGSRQHFGIYQPTGLPGAALSELFFVTTSGFVSMPSQTINPAGQFGFYLDPEGGRADPFIWFTEEALNNGQDHMILFRTPDPNVYLMVMGDSNFRPDIEDFDYNDLVIELTINRAVIPEPASMLLLGIGVSTIALGKFRRRTT